MTLPASSEAVKSCCAALYESDLARFLLGDSFHPGGVRATDRLARLVGIDDRQTILDVACGRGASALYLARTFGCHVVGIDLSERNVTAAMDAARESGLANLVSFRVGDGEAIPTRDSLFDVVICECALCTFPGKELAIAEFARVLRPGGRVGLADITRTGNLPPDLDGLLGWVACVAGAQTADDYMSHLAAAGFAELCIESHDEALGDMARAIRRKLLGMEILVNIASTSVPSIDLNRAASMASAAEIAVRDNHLGYAMIVARNPDTPSTTSASSPGIRIVTAGSGGT